MRRVPSYRKHSSGQARVTINGKDYLLGTYGSPQSKAAYGRLIAEYSAAGPSPSFGKTAESLKMEDVLLAYLRYAMTYYRDSTEYDNLRLVIRPMADLYGDLRASEFGSAEYKVIRSWWLSDLNRSRQYINKQMKRTLRVVKWAVGEGMLPAANLTAMQCVAPLKKGRCDAKEAPPVQCVDDALVEATLPHLTQVLADMVRFQRATGCRPGEVCCIKPEMVDRSTSVWQIRLTDHKTAYRGKPRTIYVGPKSQAVLAPYLSRPVDAYCFSPIESEQQRREAYHAARKTPLSCGNRPGSNVARKPRKQPGVCYTAHSYAKAIRYACDRAKLTVWAPNRLRHNAATEIRRQFGLEAASVILGHSEVGVTQVYAAADEQKAISVASIVG